MWNMKAACIVIFSVLIAFGQCLAAESVGEVPPPTLRDVKVEAQATYDMESSVYVYSYSVSNGAASTGAISDVNIDMARKSGSFDERFGNELTINLGPADSAPYSFSEEKKSLEPLFLPPQSFLVPYGTDTPVGWSGGMSRDGYASLWARNVNAQVSPGSSIDGLTLYSPGVPVIREMIIVPWWVPVFSGEPGEELKQEAGRVERAIRVHVQTLAPAGTETLSWSAFGQEIARAAELGWIPDAGLRQEIDRYLKAAAAVQQEDGTLAKEQLKALLEALSAAPADALRPEARDLIRLNAEALIRAIPGVPDSGNTGRQSAADGHR